MDTLLGAWHPPRPLRFDGMHPDNFFLYKMTIAPVLVAGATLAGRRWGDLASGLVAGFPIVAGPILFFYALEQGPLFAADAALATLLGLFSLSLFILAYAWRAWSGGTPMSCVLLGWVAFAFGTLIVQAVLRHSVPSLPRAVFYAAASLFLALRSLPPMEAPARRGAPSHWDLPLRMLAAAALVFTLTRFAQALGPKLGGLLTPFPVASTVLAVFAQRQGAGEAAVAVLKGLLLALNAFAVFCAGLVVCLPRFGLVASFGLSLLGAVGLQALIVWRRRRPRPSQHSAPSTQH
jgi:hypothetical protein